MDDSHWQIRRDIARAQRIAGGLFDERSRQVLQAYISELEAKIARAPKRDEAA